MNKMESNDAIDLSKFILSLLVVSIHINPLGGGRKYLFPWARIAVPIFFVLSSYFVWSKLIVEEANKQNIIKKFVYRNLKLYLSWFILLLPIVALKQKWFSEGILHGFKRILISFVFGSTFPASWYISSLVIGVLVIYLLSKKFSNIVLMILAGLAYSICCLLSNYGNLFGIAHILTDIEENYFVAIYNSFPVALLWIVIGKVMAEHRKNFVTKKQIVMGLIISGIFLYLENLLIIQIGSSYANDCYFLLIPIVLYAVIGMINLNIRISKSLFFRNASTVLYCSHITIGWIEGYFLRRIGVDTDKIVGGMFLYILVIISGVLLTVAIRQLEKIRSFKWLRNFY